ncbi:Os02g0481400 [Oryza sativa Japonica Group]|uniref:Os02g0481400 protein n=1 Tax=Oryza sativa subsp. japonica TaxID=39947 RepID=A0A0N7KFA7_ORYSJ|nr:Os02g0481400 [Oryza sativa Japonica Group]
MQRQCKGIWRARTDSERNNWQQMVVVIRRGGDGVATVEQPDIDDLERWAAGKARDSEVQYFENWSCARLGFSSSGCFNQHHNLDDVQAETGERILEQFKLIEKPGAVEAVESKHAQRSKRNTQNIKVSKLPPCT